nr:MAG TPA: hypothetical protein [Caudoviricetes sp.]
MPLAANFYTIRKSCKLIIKDKISIFVYYI